MYSEIRINSGKHLITVCRGTNIADKKLLTGKEKKKKWEWGKKDVSKKQEWPLAFFCSESTFPKG